MPRSNQPTLFLLAGPNGAGKSTLYADRIKPKTNAPFINADLMLAAWQAGRARRHNPPTMPTPPARKPPDNAIN